jgi:hypothetical protein
VDSLSFPLVQISPVRSIGEPLADAFLHLWVVICQFDLHLQPSVVMNHFVIQASTQFPFLKPSLSPDLDGLDENEDSQN